MLRHVRELFGAPTWCVPCTRLRGPTCWTPRHTAGYGGDYQEGAFQTQGEALHQQVQKCADLCHSPHTTCIIVACQGICYQHGLGRAKRQGGAYRCNALVNFISFLATPSFGGDASLDARLCTCVAFILQALPACKMQPDAPGSASEQSIIWLENETVCLRLLRRKNRPQGSGVLRRVCTCAGGAATCAVHTLWYQFLAELPDGAHPWRWITAGKARDRLRIILHRLGISEAGTYGTQDFRRGHAEVGTHVPTSDSNRVACPPGVRTGFEKVRLHAGSDFRCGAVEVLCVHALH